MNLVDLLSSLKPGFDPVPLAEKIRAGLAAMAGILLIGLALHFLPGSVSPDRVGFFGCRGSPVVCSPAQSDGATVAGSQKACSLSGMGECWACSMYIPDPVMAAGIADRDGSFPDAHVALFASARGSDCADHGAGSGAVPSAWLDGATGAVLANTMLSLLLALLVDDLIPGRRIRCAAWPSPH